MELPWSDAEPISPEIRANQVLALKYNNMQAKQQTSSVDENLTAENKFPFSARLNDGHIGTKLDLQKPKFQMSAMPTPLATHAEEAILVTEGAMFLQQDDKQELNETKEQPNVRIRMESISRMNESFKGEPSSPSSDGNVLDSPNLSPTSIVHDEQSKMLIQYSVRKPSIFSS